MKNKLIYKILALLGFATAATGCEIGKVMYGSPIPEPPMYGCPYAEYVANIDVTNKENTPIAGIRVGQIVTYKTKDQTFTDTLIMGATNYNGRFTLQGGDTSLPTLELIIEDVDGEENGGEFAPADATIVFNREDFVGGGDGNWNLGKYVKNVKIELEKK